METDKLKNVGRTGTVSIDGLVIPVIIVSARPRPEAVEYLVEPTRGAGQVWIDSGRVDLR